MTDRVAGCLAERILTRVSTSVEIAVDERIFRDIGERVRRRVTDALWLAVT